MNPSQLLAWLICLMLAFFAAALSVHNSYNLARLDKKFAEVERVAGDQKALLSDIHQVLQQIERNMRAIPIEASTSAPVQMSAAQPDRPPSSR